MAHDDGLKTDLNLSFGCAIMRNWETLRKVTIFSMMRFNTKTGDPWTINDRSNGSHEAQATDKKLANKDPFLH